jgi:hypothetical protein
MNNRTRTPSSVQPTSEGRRKAVRHTSIQEGSCRPATGTASTTVQLQDVSRSGIALVADRRFEPGTVLILELGEATPEALRLFVRVVRLAQHSAGRWLAGCALISELSDQEINALRAGEAGPAGRGRRASSERRASVRVPQHVVASCRLEARGALRAWAAEVQDLSREGIGLLLPSAVPQDSWLRIVLPAEGGQDPRVLRARVVRQERQADGRFLVGCQTDAPSCR